MPTDFRSLFADYVRRRGISFPDFATRVKTTKGRISKVKSGKLLPPLGSELDLWIERLRLSRREAREFQIAAKEAHVQGYAKEQIDLLRAQLLQLHQEYALLVAQHQHILAQLKSLGVQLPKINHS